MHENLSRRRSPELHAQFPSFIPDAFALPIIDRLSRFKDYVKRSAHPVPVAEKDVRSMHTSWDTVSIARRWDIEGLRTLQSNFESVIDETILLRKVDIYPYEVNKDIGAITGMDTSYTEPLTAQAQRFQEKKGVVPRLEIETDNVRRLEAWAVRVIDDERVPIGAKVMWCSPPGYPYNEYSSNGNSYIWVYEKYLDDNGCPKIRMIQHRCWPSLAQLKRIQDMFRQRAVETGHLPSSRHTKSSPRNRIIGDLIELPKEFSLEEIHSIVHAREHDEPSVEELRLFSLYRDHIFSHFLKPLYEKVFQSPDFLLPKNDPFWRSETFREAIQRLDIIFSVAHQHLQKIFGEIKSTSFVEPSGPLMSARMRELEMLCESYVKGYQGVAHDSDRSTILQAMRLIASPANAAASLGQCGVVAGLKSPTALFRPMNPAVGGGVSGMSVGMGIGGSSGEKEGTRDVSETLRQYLHQFQPLDVEARDGSFRRFWIHRDHIEEYRGKIVEKEDGLFYGPCDVCIENGEDDFVLTNEEYQRLFAETRGGRSTEEEADSHSDDEITATSLQKTADGREWRDTVNPQQLWNGDLHKPTFPSVSHYLH